MQPEDLLPQGGLEFDEACRIAAVIKAAKAAKESLIYYVGDTGSVDVGDLLDAVEALEKESDG